MKITRNIGGIDRAVRTILGIILLALTSLAFVGPQTPWAYGLGILGLLFLFTAITRFCWIYPFLGIKTFKNQEK